VGKKTPDSGDGKMLKETGTMPERNCALKQVSVGKRRVASWGKGNWKGVRGAKKTQKDSSPGRVVCCAGEWSAEETNLTVGLTRRTSFRQRYPKIRKKKTVTQV